MGIKVPKKIDGRQLSGLKWVVKCPLTLYMSLIVLNFGKNR